MTRDEFNRFCAGLPGTTHVVQWGHSDVWKVGGKLFAVAGWNDSADAFTFKTTEMGFEVLSTAPGLRPAPYLASRGMKWVQWTGPDTLSSADLRDHLKASYDMIVAKLPKKTRAELGLK